MAILKVPYTDINATMRGIRTQVIDSFEFCINEMPTFEDPEQMFKALRNMVTYKNDPPDTELLQSVDTLFRNNYWGVPGAGDCDCFSILVLAMCAAHGWNQQEIILAGRNKLMPVHIWTVVYVNGKRYSMDLTNPYINIERKYKFIQVLPV